MHPIDAGTLSIHDKRMRQARPSAVLLNTFLLTESFDPGDLGVSVFFWPHDGLFLGLEKDHEALPLLI